MELPAGKLVERFETFKSAKKRFLQHSNKTQFLRNKKTTEVQNLFDANARETKMMINDKAMKKNEEAEVENEQKAENAKTSVEKSVDSPGKK